MLIREICLINFAIMMIHGLSKVFEALTNPVLLSYLVQPSEIFRTSAGVCGSNNLKGKVVPDKLSQISYNIHQVARINIFYPKTKNMNPQATAQKWEPNVTGFLRIVPTIFHTASKSEQMSSSKPRLTYPFLYLSIPLSPPTCNSDAIHSI